MPEGHAGRFVLEVEQVELLAELAMIALLGLFQAVQIGVEFLLVAPGGAVDALQHGVARIAAPVGAGELRQLEAVAELAGARQMRAATDVEPVALAVDRDLFAGRDDVVDDLDLVVLAQLGEDALGLLAIHDLAHDGQIALDDLVHAFFDALQIGGREGLVAGEVVIEAVFDRRADGDLGARIEFLHGLRHHMGGVVAQQFERGLLVLAGDDGQLGIVIDDMGGVDEPTVDATGERGLGQTRADGGGDIMNADGLLEGALGAIGERNQRHLGSWVSVAIDTRDRVSLSRRPASGIDATLTRLEMRAIKKLPAFSERLSAGFHAES